MASEHMIDKSDAILTQLTIPKFFKLSFLIWIDLNDKMSTYQKILYVTNGITGSDCVNKFLTVDVAMQSGNQFDLQHNLCTNNADSHKRISEKVQLPAGKWHEIEYEQIPILNEDGRSSISEIIIKVNDRITNKITRSLPKEYYSMKVYYGPSQINQDSFSQLGKIQNFTLSELIQGKLQDISQSIIQVINDI